MIIFFVSKILPQRKLQKNFLFLRVTVCLITGKYFIETILTSTGLNKGDNSLHSRNQSMFLKTYSYLQYELAHQASVPVYYSSVIGKVKQERLKN